MSSRLTISFVIPLIVILICFTDGRLDYRNSVPRWQQTSYQDSYKSKNDTRQFLRWNQLLLCQAGIKMHYRFLFIKCVLIVRLEHGNWFCLWAEYKRNIPESMDSNTELPPYHWCIMKNLIAWISQFFLLPHLRVGLNDKYTVCHILPLEEVVKYQNNA